METLEGVILECDGDYAKVRPKKHTECDDCQACFASDLVVLVYNPRRAVVGQTVRYVQARQGMLVVAWVLFGQPLLAVFLGLALGSLAAPMLGLPVGTAMAAGSLALFGLAVAFLLRFDRRFKRTQSNFARVTEILP